MRIIYLFLPIILLGQSMTVYKDNIALVKEPVYWSVQAGLSEITYDQLNQIPNVTPIDAVAILKQQKLCQQESFQSPVNCH